MRARCPAADLVDEAELGSEKGVRLAQKVQVGPCTPVRTRLEKTEVGPTSGPTWRLSHLLALGRRDVPAGQHHAHRPLHPDHPRQPQHAWPRAAKSWPRSPQYFRHAGHCHARLHGHFQWGLSIRSRAGLCESDFTAPWLGAPPAPAKSPTFGSHGRWSHSHAAWYISFVIPHTQYTKRRLNDSTVYFH
jgi:hypothetical protein